MSDADAGTARDLAAAYALGALDAPEAAAFERLLAADPALAREVDEYREVAALLALGATDDAGPMARLRERVLAGTPPAQAPRVPVAPEARPAPSPRRAGVRWLVPAALAASLVLAAGLGLERGRLAARLAATERTLAEREARLARREATLDALLAPGVELYQMSASGDPDPIVQFFWDRARNTAILHSFAVRLLPEDRVYQLWFIKDGAPVPSITFRPEEGGHAAVERIAVPADGKVSAIAITEEPAGGSSRPTSPIYLLGRLDQPRGPQRNWVPGA